MGDGRVEAGPVLEEEVSEGGVFIKAPTEPGLALRLDPAVAEETRVS